MGIMQIVVTFGEIERYIAKNFQKNISLQYADNKTITVSLQKEQGGGVFAFVGNVINSASRINVSVKSVTYDTVTLSYNGNGVIKSVLLSSVVKFFKNKISDIYKESGGGDLIVYLQKIKQLEKVFQYCSLQDISFKIDSIAVDSVIK